MGAVRSLPENQAKTVSFIDNDCYYVSVSLCGWQYYMQDFTVSVSEGPTKLIAIFDGHNGPQVAEYCSMKIPSMVKNNRQIEQGDLSQGLQDIIYQLQAGLIDAHEQLNQIRAKYSIPALKSGQVSRAGCSCIVIAMNQEQIAIKNIGPCRCYVTFKDNPTTAILKSENHIASNPTEQARILQAGGFVYNGRVNGTHAHTRSLGDLHLKACSQGQNKPNKQQSKKAVISWEPSGFSLMREQVSSILMGSSGIWEQEHRVKTVFERLGRSKEQDQQEMERFLDQLIAPETGHQNVGLQNMTLSYISLRH